jgi:S1-C subfamily serine protease
MVAADAARVYVVTCGHVVDLSRAARTRLRAAWLGSDTSDGRMEWRSADVDLAIVSAERPVRGELPDLVPVGDVTGIHVGQRVFAVGDPISYRTSMVAGVVSAVRRLGSGSSAVRVIQSQIPLNPGNSGGGLYTEDGLLIGINSWTPSKMEVEGMGFSIAVDELRERATSLPEPVAVALAEPSARRP